MAKNIIFGGRSTLDVTCTQPATPASGDPVLFGDHPGVAVTDERANGKTTVAFADGNTVVEIPVKGIDAGGNSAVVEGDKLYYVSADTPKVSKKNTGVPYGTAMAGVGSGLTATIRVRIGK